MQGAAGTGKSTVAALFAASAAEHGLRTAMFIFDESANTLFSRLDGLGIDLSQYDDAGHDQLTPDRSRRVVAGRIRQLDARSRSSVGGASIVVIDSLNGYLHSMPDENSWSSSCTSCSATWASAASPRCWSRRSRA